MNTFKPSFLSYSPKYNTNIALLIACIMGLFLQSHSVYATKYEAENANLIGVSVGNSEAGFSGTGHTTANSFDSPSDKIIFTVNVASAGNYPLVIRYKNSSNGEKYQYISINGGNNEYTRFPGSASWTDLNYGDVALNAGNNTIEISKSWGWTNIDYIDVDDGGTSGELQRYEAESANLVGVSAGNSVAGFSGTGHTTANSFDSPSDKIIFTVNVASAGNYPLVIRYKNSSNGEKYQNISINGGNNEYTRFPGSASWTDLNYGDVALNAGNNTIEISKSWGWTNIDYIDVGSGDDGGGSELQKYEAENANLVGVSTGNSVAGFSGTGHTTASSFDNPFDKIIFTVNVASAGDYPLVIRYKNIGNGEKYQNVSVNGSNQYTHFPGSTSWTDLNYGNVTLNAGNNTIEISKSWGWTNIDYIEVGGGTTTPDIDLVTPNPTPETVELWEYLKSVTPQEILSGVWSQADGQEDIFTHSGRRAAILGFDLWCWHPYDSDVCERVQQNEIIDAAISHANDGGIVQINWHWGNPFATSFSGLNAWVSTGGALTDAQWNNLVTPGTFEYNTIIADIDRHANDVLKLIKYNSGKRIPILFRPLHEIDGGWFWWTNKNDPSKTVALWNIIFDRLTYHHNLNNLIWVWNNSEVAKTSQVSGQFYPGDDKADILAADIYTIDYQNTGIRDETWNGGIDLSYKDFYDILQEISPNKPKALSECDALPNPDKIQSGQTNFDVPWVYVLAWWTPLDGSRASCDTSPCNPSFWVDYTYNHGLYITLDELPAFSNKEVTTDYNSLQLRNYPNPFVRQTTIEFTLTNDSPVSLYISDVTGKQLQILLNNESRQSGINTIHFDANAYASGMYYYTIQTKEYSGTQKMLIVK